MTQYVYYFGDGVADGDATMKSLLGGKGANLAEMVRIGLPVPAGFTLTTEVWETQNATWLELKEKLSSGVLEQDPAQFFEWVKFRSHLARGVIQGTMLRDELQKWTAVARAVR